jgi:hypothetical protein
MCLIRSESTHVLDPRLLKEAAVGFEKKVNLLSSMPPLTGLPAGRSNAGNRNGSRSFFAACSANEGFTFLTTAAITDATVDYGYVVWS